MKYRVLFLAVAILLPGVSQATIVGFGQIGGSNTTVPATLASQATADGNGFVVTNGTTPNIDLTWDSGWDIHTSDHFGTLENQTVGGGDWDNEGPDERIGQLDFGTHTIGFAVDPGAQLVLNSFDFAHTAETAGTTEWNLELTDSGTNLVWDQTVMFVDGSTQTIAPSFTGSMGEDYTLTFTRTSETYGSNGRHGLDNLSFNQLPDLSVPVGALVINRSGPDAGTAFIRADQAFSFGEYQIESLSGALNPTGWTSITSTNADPSDDWSILSNTVTSLHEKDGPTGPNDGLSLALNAEYDLGDAFSVLPTFREDGTTPTNWEDAGIVVYDQSGEILGVTPEYTGTPVPWGDYNGDLSVDIQDWPLFRAGLGGDYTGLTDVEAYLGGDLDGDLDSDIHDFNLFVELAGGTGALFGTNQIPEPTSVVLIALGGLALWTGRRFRGVVAVLVAVAATTFGATVQADTLQDFSVVGSTPTTSIPAGQENENENASPDQFFDDIILDEAGHIVTDLFFVDYTDPILFPTQLGQYAIGGEMPGAVDSAVVFMDYGSSVTTNWFAYAQRTGGNPVADKVGKFEFWFSNADFAGVVPTGTPNAVVDLLPGDNRIDDSVLRPYTLGGNHSGRYVAMRITETDASGALTSTSRIGGHEFRLLDGPSDVVLTVNRADGEMTLRNNLDSGAENIFMNTYTIESPGGGLAPGSFDGVRGDAMFAAGNGTGNGWELAEGSNTNRLVESYFNGETMFTAGTSPISLGNAYNSLSGIEDLVFLWTNSQGEVYNARVEYVGVSANLIGDYNDDGIVNAADYTVWRDNLGTNITLPNDSTPGSVTSADYVIWKNNFGMSTPLSGSLSGGNVPEPNTALLLCGAAGLAIGLLRRRKA